MNSLKLYEVTNPLVNAEDIADHNGVGAVIHNRNYPHLILIFFHKKYQFWTIPVGKVSLGEDIANGIATEVKEETGINILTVRKLGMFAKTYDRGQNIKTYIESYLYDVSDYCGGEPVNMEPHKHPIMVWKSIEELEAYKPEELSDLTRFYIYLQKGILNIPSVQLIK